MLTDSKGIPAQIGRYGDTNIVTLGDTNALASGELKAFTAYEIYFSASGTFKWGPSSVVATDDDVPITAGLPKMHMTDGDNLYISCKVPTGTGKCSITEVALG